MVRAVPLLQPEVAVTVVHPQHRAPGSYGGFASLPDAIGVDKGRLRPNPVSFCDGYSGMNLRAGLATVCAMSAVAVCGDEIPVAEAESVGMSTERLQQIDAAMQRHIDAGKIQGAVTAVARRGRVVTSRPTGSSTSRPNARCRKTRFSSWRRRRNRSSASPR